MIEGDDVKYTTRILNFCWKRNKERIVDSILVVVYILLILNSYTILASSDKANTSWYTSFYITNSNTTLTFSFSLKTKL